MSRTQILTFEESKELFNRYHEYLSECKEMNKKPILKSFTKDLIKNNPTFAKIDSKCLENKIEQERLKHGDILWPRISKIKCDIQKYEKPTLRKHLDLLFYTLKESIESFDLFSLSDNKGIKEVLTNLANEILDISYTNNEIKMLGNEKEAINYLVESYPNLLNEINNLSPSKITNFIENEVNMNFARYSNIISEVLKYNITESDVKAIAYRKKQLEEFEKMLNDEEYFNSKKSVGEKNYTSENVWQNFLKKISGYLDIV